MEELRPVLADRLALSLINRRQLRAKDFETRDGGAILLTIFMWMLSLCTAKWSLRPPDANLVMGFFFGGLHLAYGIYLYFTEKQPSVA